MADNKPKPPADDVRSQAKRVPLSVPMDVVPEIYVDGFQGVLVSSGVVKLNLYSEIQDFASDKSSKRIVAHLTMPLLVLFSFYEALGKVIETMERDGIFERPTSKKKAKK